MHIPISDRETEFTAAIEKNYFENIIKKKWFIKKYPELIATIEKNVLLRSNDKSKPATKKRKKKVIHNPIIQMRPIRVYYN